MVSFSPHLDSVIDEAIVGEKVTFQAELYNPFMCEHFDSFRQNRTVH